MNLIDAKKSTSKFQLNPPHLFRILESKKSEFVENILKLAKDAEYMLSRINEVFPHFTLHDIDHSIRVADNIFALIEDPDSLSELEIAACISASLLHDIGMYASIDEVKCIKDGSLTYGGIKYEKLVEMFSDESLAVQDLVRRFHGKRSYDFVIDKFRDYLSIPSQPAVSFAEDIALICQGHTTDFNWLNQKLMSKKILSDYEFNPIYCATLLRLGDVLDFDSQRTPLFLYKLISPKGISDVEWKKHFQITNNQKVIKSSDSEFRQIEFYGQCDDPNVHRLILTYFDWINREIKSSISTTSKFDKKYRLNLRYPLENNVIPQGYTISDLKLSIDYLAISNLLMGENIYGNKKYGIRELIQNSIDACGVRRSIENNKRDAWDEPYIPRISIIIDNERVIFKDNGIGMSYEIIKNYFLNTRIKIDPETFNVTLFDRKDKVINKNSLSSGELEIYAMSMLWALAKTSGQKLPFIVDTPLARLDSKHRDNLVELFFPHASHQMMIFSTNTEVDQQYFNRLRPYVAHAYNLEYCEESKSTVVKEGYFWN